MIHLLALRCDGNLLGHGPQESTHLTGHRHHNLMGLLASRDEASVACAQAHLGFPANVLDDFRLLFESQLQVSTDVGGVAVRPGAFT